MALLNGALIVVRTKIIPARIGALFKLYKSAIFETEVVIEGVELVANAVFNNIHISGIACAVPEKVEKITDYIDELGENEVYKFIETTGVKDFTV